MTMRLLTAILLIAVTTGLAQPAASIETVVGIAELNSSRKPGWKPARIGGRLFVKDEFRTGSESRAELRWKNGGIVRVAEQSSLVIEPAAAGQTPSPKALTGRLWANMKAITSSEKSFKIETPTAVAAIRGTVFSVDVDSDSATGVKVYEGKVAVGPGALLPGKGDAEKRREVDGPREVEGPQEVTLEEWVEIVAGQMIRVERDGSFSKSEFDRKSDSSDAWVKYNLRRDEAMK